MEAYVCENLDSALVFFAKVSGAKIRLSDWNENEYFICDTRMIKSGVFYLDGHFYSNGKFIESRVISTYNGFEETGTGVNWSFYEDNTIFVIERFLNDMKPILTKNIKMFKNRLIELKEKLLTS